MKRAGRLAAMLGGLVLTLGIAWVTLGWRQWPRVEAIPSDPRLDLNASFRPVFGLPGGRDAQPPDLTSPILTLAQDSDHSPRRDTRDYVSLSIYWWPNPLTRLPYLPRDGHRNPEAGHYDAIKLQHMATLVGRLAKAGQQAHDQRALEWLRAWFIDPDTRMHPHLTYAQMMPGLAAGGRQGIIEGLPIVTHVLDALAALDQRQALPAADRSALRSWLGEYLAWLCHSRPGQAEAKRPNNHGTWYDVQEAALAISLGLYSLSQHTLAQAKHRIAIQFSADGRQPQELRRSKSFEYSLYNLQAWQRLHVLGLRLSQDLWNARAENGASPALGLDYLRQHARQWPHPQLHPPSPSALEALEKALDPTPQIR